MAAFRLEIVDSLAEADGAALVLFDSFYGLVGGGVVGQVVGSVVGYCWSESLVRIVRIVCGRIWGKIGWMGRGISKEELEEIARRLAATTSGPWEAFVEGRDHLGGDDFIRTGGPDGASPDIYVSVSSRDGVRPARVEDLDFIANARQDVALLLEVVSSGKASPGVGRPATDSEPRLGRAHSRTAPRDDEPMARVARNRGHTNRMWTLDPGNSPLLMAALSPHWRSGGADVAWLGEGWRPLVERCHMEIVEQFPDYELLAIKQKWGALEIQAFPRPWSADTAKFSAEEVRTLENIIDKYFALSLWICELCGSRARLREDREVEVTLCDECDERFSDAPRPGDD